MANFTIDDLEIERNEDFFEYTAKSKHVYRFADPKALKGRTLLAFQQGQFTAEEFLIILLGGDKFDEFMDEDEVDGYVLDPLLVKWGQHYGINLDAGKAPSSNSPSTGSARSSKQTSRGGTRKSR